MCKCICSVCVKSEERRGEVEGLRFPFFQKPASQPARYPHQNGKEKHNPATHATRASPARSPPHSSQLPFIHFVSPPDASAVSAFSVRTRILCASRKQRSSKSTHAAWPGGTAPSTPTPNAPDAADREESTSWSLP